MTADRDRPGEAGFLLVEMLATMTISAFVLIGLVALGSVIVRAADRSVAAIGSSEDLARTVSSLDGLIGTAVRARLDGAPSQPFLFNGDDRRLMVAHRDTTPGALPVTRVVALRSEAGRLLRAEAALPARVGALDELHFGPPRELYAGDATIRFTYVASPSSAGAAEPSLSRWPTGSAMPSAVIVEALDRTSGRVLLRGRATLFANADRGCLVDGACGFTNRTSGQRAQADAASLVPNMGTMP